MATPKRILYVSSEVAPFVDGSETARLVRHLSEQLNEEDGHDVRMMMPRYGLINERKNQLHEVIRLSKSKVAVADEEYPVTVKVASIPDTRQQVYFADNPHFFDRKAIYTDDDGESFDDNAARALFFGRAVLSTLELLHWAPDVLHTVGAMGGFVPMLVREKRSQGDFFAGTRTLYTPETGAPETEYTAEQLAALGADLPATVEDPVSLTELGIHYADAVIFPSSLTSTDGHSQFSEDASAVGGEATTLYDQVSSEVVA